MQIDVTSTARRAEPVGTTAAAVSVITGDDIRRAGVTTIADALALADGVHVARSNNGSWAVVGARLQRQHAEQAAGDGRRPHGLLAALHRRVLEHPRLRARGHRPHRGDPRPGRDALGRQRRQRRHQHHHAPLARYARRLRERVGRQRGPRDRRGSLRRRHAATRRGACTASSPTATASSFSTGGASGDPRRRGQAGFRVDGGDSAGTNWMLLGNAFHSRDELPDRAAGRVHRSVAAGALVGAAVGHVAPRRAVVLPPRVPPRPAAAHAPHRHRSTSTPSTPLVLGTRHNIVWGGGVRINRDNTHGSAAIRFDPDSRASTPLPTCSSRTRSRSSPAGRS